MNPANTSSGPSTGTTSTSDPRRQPPPPRPPESPSPARDAGADRPATPTGESQFLQEQAVAARQAITAALTEMKSKLTGAGGAGASLGSITRDHPWLTAGAAGVAGFAVASMLVPSKTDQALKRLARIERAINPPPPAPPTAHVDSEGKAHKGAKPGIGAVLVREFANILKPTIMSLVTAGFTAKAASEVAQEKTAQQPPAPPTEAGQPVSTGPVPAAEAP